MSTLGPNNEIENEFQHDGTNHGITHVYSPAYYQDHKEAHAKSRKQWNSAHKEEKAAYDRYWRYGLSDEEYRLLLDTQDGRCAICNKTPNEAKQSSRLHIEHSHTTGIVRGLVCIHCNRHISWYEKHRDKLEEYIDV